jgi:hypothetical protein
MPCGKLIMLLKQTELDLPLPPPKGDIPLWRGQGEVRHANFSTQFFLCNTSK